MYSSKKRKTKGLSQCYDRIWNADNKSTDILVGKNINMALCLCLFYCPPPPQVSVCCCLDESSDGKQGGKEESLPDQSHF